jgi:hypothetical protein
MTTGHIEASPTRSQTLHVVSDADDGLERVSGNATCSSLESGSAGSVVSITLKTHHLLCS